MSELSLFSAGLKPFNCLTLAHEIRVFCNMCQICIEIGIVTSKFKRDFQ